MRSSFGRLIGAWKTSGQVANGNGVIQFNGTDTYEYILDGCFILHKADVYMGDEKNETHEIISFDSATGQGTMQYFNNKNQSGAMRSVINGTDFHIDGDTLRFRGNINDNDTEIVGKWFVKTNDKWNEFINVKLEKKH